MHDPYEKPTIRKFIPRHLQRPPVPVVRIPPPKITAVVIEMPKPMPPAPPAPTAITNSHARAIKLAAKAGRLMREVEPSVPAEIKVKVGEVFTLDHTASLYLRIRTVIAATLSASGMNHPLLVGGSRARDVVEWRMASIYVAKRLTGASTVALGRLYHRDHSTVIHALQVAEHRASVLAHTKAILEKIA